MRENEILKNMHEWQMPTDPLRSVKSFRAPPQQESSSVTMAFIDLLSYKGNLRALYACSHE